jgi:hypothetical protein
MKYIRLYEELLEEHLYKIGDYVILTSHAIDIWTRSPHHSLILPIVLIQYIGNNYSVVLYNIDGSGSEKVLAEERNILRKATIQEIEELKILLDAKRYNL